MKKYFLSCLFLLLSFISLKAQDTLYKRNGEMLYVKVQEVNPENIKYHKIDFLEGPLYSIEKAEVFMIHYQNGYKEVFAEQAKKSEDDYAVSSKPQSKSSVFSLDDIMNNPISVDGYRYSIGYLTLAPKKVDKLILERKDKQLSVMITSAQSNKKTSKLLSFAPIPFGVGAYISLLAASIASTNYYNQSSTSNYLALTGVFAAAALGSGIGAIVLNSKSKKLRKAAVLQYNSRYYGIN